jgi:hypothetical protein
LFCRDFLGIQVNLHPARVIGEIDEMAFAHIPVGSDAASSADGLPLGKGYADFPR